MAKAINVLYGIGIAIVLYSLILLGIQAFYPSSGSDYQTRAVNIFLIESITGIIFMVVSIFLLKMKNVSAGILAAGLLLVATSYFYAFMSQSYKLMFVIALIVAIIVIAFALFVRNQKEED